MLRSYLCDYSDAYIVGKGTIDLLVDAANENDKAEKGFGLKDNAPFRSCILKINSTLISNVENLDVVILICNLLEYSHSVSLGTDLSLASHNPGILLSFQALENLISPPRQEKSPDNSNVLHMLNNNTDTDFRAAYFSSLF